jgi:lipoate---protein ligase
MRCLDLSLPTPEENLALDEVLLDACDEARIGSVLRFWEAPSRFVVVGYGNCVDSEVDRAACQADGIPILRRCSGGGTVLQAPGCLNYSLIMRIEDASELGTIPSTNCFVMQRHAQELAGLLRRPVEVCGHTDLAVGGLKFSGNAQRRKKHALIFHGTFLLSLKLNEVGRFLRMPSKQPEYRNERTHLDFLTNLELPSVKVKEALAQLWQAHETLSGEWNARDLVASKYSRAEWNLKL